VEYISHSTLSQIKRNSVQNVKEEEDQEVAGGDVGGKPNYEIYYGQ